MEMVGLLGVTAIDCNTAAVTVNVVDPLIPPRAALMVEVPALTPVASPAVVIVATAVVPEVQVTWLVRFCVEASE